MIASGKRFDYPSQKGHEDGCPSHGEEINHCHGCACNGDGKEFLCMGVDDHPKTAEETDGEEDEAIPERALNLQNPDQREEAQSVKSHPT